MPTDPLEALLRRSPLVDKQRDALWTLYDSTPTADELKTRLNDYSVPREVKDRLFVLKSQETAPVPSEVSAQPDGSALGLFASGAGEMLNPVTMAKGLYNTVRHPIDTGTAILGQQGQQFTKAVDAAKEGRYLEAAGHGAATLLPVVGPLAADIGEQIGSGDVAGGLGKTVGLLAPMGASSALRAGAAVAPEAVAGALERGAASRVQAGLTPKSASVKGLRMGAKAEAIAPEIASEMETAPWSQSGFRAKMADQFNAAKSELDEVADARLSARAFRTEPILKSLRAKRAALEAEALDASLPEREVSKRASSILDETGRPIEVTTAKEVPMGRTIVPEPNMAQAGPIDAAIAEVEALGPMASYESLRKIRAAYDKPASVVYNPATTPDFLLKRDAAIGAADVTGVLREHLAGMDPATAVANKKFSLYKSATDLTNAIEELERSRPKVGRKIMARLTSSLVGGQAAGIPGAAVGYVIGPVIDEVSSLGLTTRFQVAKAMAGMAKAIRNGDAMGAEVASTRLRKLVPSISTRLGAIPSQEPVTSR